MGPEHGLAVTGIAVQAATLLKDLIGLISGYLEANSTFRNLQDTSQSVMEVVAQFNEMLLAPGADEAFSSESMKVNFSNFLYQFRSLKNILDQLGDVIKKFARKARKLSIKGEIWWASADLDPVESLACSILGHIASLSLAVQMLEMAKLSSMSSKMDRYHKSSEAIANEHSKEIKEKLQRSEQEQDKD